MNNGNTFINKKYMTMRHNLSNHLFLKYSKVSFVKI